MLLLGGLSPINVDCSTLIIEKIMQAIVIDGKHIDDYCLISELLDY